MDNTKLVPTLDSTPDLREEIALCRRIQKAIAGKSVQSALNALGRTMHALQRHLQAEQEAQRPALQAVPPAANVC